ncbi:MAG TPA: Mur ligase family protein [Longimicrobiales bacterium]|nr:Mur ligase family protein [Longimicrobiales bacterium]
MKELTIAQLCRSLPESVVPATAADIAIGHVRDDSRLVERGDLFVAVRGAAADGSEHIAEAVARGAAAVVVEEGSATTVNSADAADAVPLIRVPDARIALAEIAAASFGFPARRLQIVGITGTVGKTSVLAMLSRILTEAGISAGSIGSLGITYGDASAATRNTTPGALQVQEALSGMAGAGVRIAAMEVTSHALAQERVRGVMCDLGIFTNLTMLEHLEYHGSFREYAAAKLRFLDLLKPQAPLCYAAGDRVVRQAARRHGGPRVSCGGGGAWVGVRRDSLSLNGTRITLNVRRALPRLDGSTLPSCTVPLKLQTLGRPNTMNATLAAAAGLIAGASPEVVQRALARIPAPRRRLEVIHRRGPIVIDDTVGHPDSITGVFEMAERIPHRQLRVVFCIRGRRGEEINMRDAEALAIWARRVHIDRLAITSAVDTADERNDVSAGERRAFLDVLQGASVPHTHHPRLDDAIATVVQDAVEDDLIFLLGAQGMDAGASIIERALSS